MSPQQTIAHYRITAKLGEGGMGEVWRATDTKLNRDVAIKILPEAFAQDADRMARFQREAQVLASLNHPNIAAIYGVEERALVMELVEGPTLADQIARGPVALEEALPILKQIADAVEYAHERGVVHRDLKPANIKITPEGRVKVLDFGLAKAIATEAPAADPASSPTLTMRSTALGVIMGTAAYMSPEQAKGKPVDRRGDIWAFGVVLMEMLTGRPLYTGETVSETLAAVIRDQPDIKRLPAATPADIRRLARRCLDKDPQNRLRDIGEARVAIHEALEGGATAEAVPVIAGRSRALSFAIATTVLALALFGLGVLYWRATRQVERPLVRLDVDLGHELSLDSSSGPDAIISPDGSRLVFVAKSRLYTRRLNQEKAIELAGTEKAVGPFFAPDGQWVAFYANGKLKKISVEGGTAIALCDTPNLFGGAWGEDHNVIFGTSYAGLLRIPDSGGVPQPLTKLAQGEFRYSWPQILPGGKDVLFTANAGDAANIEVLSLKEHRRKTLVPGGTYARYLPTSAGAASRGAGHLVYINKGTLFATVFDPDTLSLRGTPAPVLHEVSYSPTLGSAQLDFSQTGTLVYRSSGGAGGMVTLQWLDSAGGLRALPAKPGPYLQTRLSPDGRLVALAVNNESGSDIWTYDWQRDNMSRLTFGNGTFNYLVWSPDRRNLVFHADSGIFWIRTDGSGKAQPLTQSKNGQYPWSFSPDGNRLAFAEAALDGFHLWTVPVENDGGQLRAGTPEVFLRAPSVGTLPAFSPDGRWIAYKSYELGAAEIFVRSFPDKGGKWQISNNGGMFAVWSPNGRELFYRTPEQQIMVVDYTASGDSFVPGKPRLWSEKRLADTSWYQNLDIAPDGKRFLVLMPAETGQQRANNDVIFLLNFFDYLRQRVPVEQK